MGKDGAKSSDNSIVVNLNNYGNSYGIVQRACAKRGWKVAKKQGEFWDVGWSDSNKAVQAVQKMANHRYLSPVQRINHFPGNKQIYRKDLLGKNLNAMARLRPHDYNFHPRTWNIPEDRAELEQAMAAEGKSTIPL
eukprot:TRINITY_DN2976_c0_g3_i1.p3 TRINITY_DN2976_c0_g3~~TRINITY_DN2976_c0_g3_i1.p3  ORF type:complete len:136 (+),score=33.41 TRINITY_DN2976_c0_g3_i1:206-613(+)